MAATQTDPELAAMRIDERKLAQVAAQAHRAGADGTGPQCQIEPAAHGVGADAVERVADRHVEQRLPGVLLHAQQIGRSVDHVPAVHVLVERLLEEQLLRPLDVEAHVLHVDAGARDLELIEDLHRLELDDAGSPEPGEQDVLRELGVGAGRGADAGGGSRAVVDDGEIHPRARAVPHLARLEVIDGAAGRVLGVHATE